MRAKYWVYCNRASGSAVRLARELGGRRIKRVGSKYRQKPGDIVINYGCTNTPGIRPTYQQPAGVYRACSKMATFDALDRAGLPHPDWTTDKDQAQGWLATGKVLGRDLDRGSQGRGITVYKKGEMLGDHLFYVKYMKKEREFRFHVVRGTVIHVQEKLRMNKERRNGDNYYVRSHGNGWVLAFTHLEANPPPVGGAELAQSAAACLGLNVAGVDMGYSDDTGYFILELNSAPGVEGETLKRYASAFLKEYDEGPDWYD